jgi:ParB family chromosome partitioning protein
MSRPAGGSSATSFRRKPASGWLDIALLERLAGEKLQALAQEMAVTTGLAWVRPTLDSWVGHSLTYGLKRVVPEREPLSTRSAAVSTP